MEHSEALPWSGPSHKWLRNFLKRHKEVSLRKPHGLSRVRSKVTNEQINEFYKLLDETLQKLRIKNDPTKIFSFDETGLHPKCLVGRKIIITKSSKHLYQPTVSISGGHITLQLAISAADNTADKAPLVIYSKYLLRNNFTEVIPEEWRFATSESRYINSELFLSWFQESFVKQCGRALPICVVMNNHVTHLNKELIDFAKKEHIDMICVPANSTHLLQPLDVGYYHLLKQNFANLSVALGYTGMKTVPKN
ncbi:uncharacterized protein LOC123530264 [Mercenaria mercenaria]|uniref:uncharacterized protein LOC123530264 n=1 Tax=Mercenaria mercenaria TaxID=6596 RepID=UPI00234FAFDA|nr:uncharacterized protein LOC123530264 [Mercenaria mercenaria]